MQRHEEDRAAAPGPVHLAVKASGGKETSCGEAAWLATLRASA